MKELEPPTTLSHYRIVSKLGVGGMGEVYLAHDTKLDRQVALKILPKEFANDRDRMNRFIREAKSASALSHPNIITIYEIGETDGTHFIAAEYIQGETLHARLTHGALDLKTMLDVAIQVASALNAAHKAGITHRDIKPENVMVRPDALVKILDFGIAKLLATNIGPTDEEAATAIKPQGTNPGVIIGTANYMSPEQARGKDVGAQSDIFSFGIVLYEMVTGQRAFTGDNALDVIGAILHKEPTPLSQLSPDLPPDIERIINKTLRKDRGARYQTAGDLLTDLKDAKQDFDFQDTLHRKVAPQSQQQETQTIIPSSTDSPREVQSSTSSLEYAVSQAKSHKLAAVMLGLVLLGALTTVAYFAFSSKPGGTKEISSIAVLPFANATGDKEADFLADGIAETLINNFTKIADLKVAARSTAFRFRGREGEPQTIGRELAVGSMLAGRLMQRGDQLSVQVDLINTSDGAQIWGNRYEGKTSDIVSIQQRIATDVSSQLKLKLTGAQTQQITKTYTQNPEAYQRYLRGRYHWNRRTESDLRKAIEEYQAAAAADPAYAMAYVGLGESYLLLPEYAGTHFADSIPQARIFAEKALAIDPSLGEPHATLGLINHYSWRWDDANREFEKAIEINPNYPTVHHWYSNNLRETGKYPEALAEIKRAKELDPLSTIIGVNTGILLKLNGDPAAGRQQLTRTIELDPTWFNGHFWLGCMSLMEDRFEEAIPNLQRAVDLNRAIRPIGILGFAFAKAGRKNEALALLKELELRYANGIACASDIASIYVGLGETEKAFEWLERSYKDKDADLPRLRWYPPFASLRPDPRFKDILQRLNLPE